MLRRQEAQNGAGQSSCLEGLARGPLTCPEKMKPFVPREQQKQGPPLGSVQGNKLTFLANYWPCCRPYVNLSALGLTNRDKSALMPAGTAAETNLDVLTFLWAKPKEPDRDLQTDGRASILRGRLDLCCSNLLARPAPRDLRWVCVSGCVGVLAWPHSHLCPASFLGLTSVHEPVSWANSRKHREGFFRAEPLDKLHRAKLHRAKLHRAKLHRAKLHRAKLHRAKLHRAKLHRTKLPRAKLHRAKLHRAKLHRAKLHRAKLHRAKLHRAKLP